MSDDPNTLTAEQRKTAIANWLRPVAPANPTKPKVVDRIGPWRHELVEAVAEGYSWSQLAKHVAKQPEIGITISGDYLKQCVRQAFVEAKEAPPRETHATRRPKKKSAAKQTPTPAATK